MEFKNSTDGILLELALTIGESTGCDMLNSVLPFFIEKLNCCGAAVLQFNGKAEGNLILGFGNEEQALLKAQAPSWYNMLISKEQLYDNTWHSGEYHIFLLSGYGMLVLRFSENPVSGLVQKLLPIIKHFALASQRLEKQNRQLQDQKFITNLAIELINMPLENIDKAVDRLLAAFGNSIETDRVFVFGYNFVKCTMSNTHEWCNTAISSEITNLQQIPNKFLHTWVEAHQKGEMFQVQDVAEIDKSDPQSAILRLQGIKSIVTLPVVLHGECIGFVGFNSVKTAKTWNSNEIASLRMLSDILSNIAERKRKEESLQNREASLKAIFDNVPFQMWLKDTNSKYIAVNKPFMDYFSIPGENDIIGKDAMDIWHNEIGSHFIDQDKQVMQFREMRSTEELIDFKHKSVWFEIFRVPIIDQNGQILGTAGIAQDITKKKNAEKALQQAVKTAQAATEAKSKYLAIMSHEIRNPLNAVVGMVRMLHETGTEGPNSKLINNIKTSSDHLLMIVNDILDFSKIEAGDMILEETCFDIHDVMSRVCNSHIYSAKEKNIELKVTINDQIGHSHTGDPLRLQQVLGNLVSNAVKFTAEGLIELCCELESSAHGDETIRFEVKDTGIGINSESQKKIFESFKQEDNTITRTYGGSGLGLAISKQIVELMGGYLCVESEKNVGSKFYFSINLPVSETDISHGDDSRVAIANNSLSGYSILLVEDNKLNQILATTILENWGAHVTIANNGQQAVDIVTSFSFDIILMDIQMPVMDGLSASKLIRNELNIETPILALSANVIKGIVDKCTEAGMQGYISKPFDSDDLYRKIITHVSKRRIKAENNEEVDQDVVVSDISRLEKMIGADPAQLKVMLNKFLLITPSYVAELNEAETLNNLETIAAVSHKIKSSIDLVSAPVLRELILNINQSSKQGSDIKNIRSLIRKFNNYYNLLEIQLRQEINSEKTLYQAG